MTATRVPQHRTKSGGYDVSVAPCSVAPLLEAVTLSSPEGMSVEFVPKAGMVGVSLKHHGEEILGQRGGLRDYLTRGETFGIPLLAPWGNRLHRQEYRGVKLAAAGTPGMHYDPNGIPIHGTMPGCPGWEIVACWTDKSCAALEAEWICTPALPRYAAFPFPQVLQVKAILRGTVLEIRTRVLATGGEPVPLAVGWHPYFAPPGAPRADWVMSNPFDTHAVLSDLLIPTGITEPVDPWVRRLGDPSAEDGITLDDLYCGVVPGTVAWIEGGGRRISVRYSDGYGYAVLFAPPDQDLVAVEPMSAPTDPFGGHFGVREVWPGTSAICSFSIGVGPAGEEPT